jgi:hypothetical protein
MLKRLNSLRTKHAILDAKIDREHNHFNPDLLRLRNLKKMRLRYKEEIAKLEMRLSGQAA